MKGNLNFAELVPERDTFTDEDGTVYEFRAQADFGAIDVARSRRLNQEIQRQLEFLNSDDASEEAAQAFVAASDAVLAQILPSLPPERLAALTMGQKTQILDWWNARNIPAREKGRAAQEPGGEAAQPEGEAPSQPG